MYSKQIGLIKPQAFRKRNNGMSFNSTAKLKLRKRIESSNKKSELPPKINGLEIVHSSDSENRIYLCLIISSIIINEDKRKMR